MISTGPRYVLLLAVAATLTLPACATSDTPEVQPEQSEVTTSAASSEEKGAAIGVPVCDFVAISAEQAAQILGYTVTATSDTGDKDPSGGSCKFQPAAPSSAAFEVTVAVFPDTTDGFEAFIKKFTAATSKTGNRLWTSPERVPGDARTYTFRSPVGGYDSVWVLDDGYRIMVSDQNKSDVPGAADKVMAMAEAAADGVRGT